MRARNIKPGFFKNESLGEIDPLARLLFIGLWCMADKEGRLEDRPKRIKAEILPYDSSNVEKLLEQLRAAQFIVRYGDEETGRRFIQIHNFVKHQNPHKNEKPSEIPSIEECREITGALREKHHSARADSLNPDSLNPDLKDIVETEKPASTAALDYGAISRLFGDKCPSLPKPQKMTDARKAAAKKLWEQNKDKHQTPELFFSEFFQKVEASEFLSGRNGKWGGCCFDWVLNPTNALKILEGNYSGAPQRQETPHLSGRVYVTAEEAEAMERVRREYEQQH